MDSKKSAEVPFLTSLISGGIAGTSVDVALFPLDTIKTRLQSSQGFLKAGGFRGIYRGLSAAAAGSAPGAALFFCTYESMKNTIRRNDEKKSLADPVVHMISACCGEVAACMVRVPTEVVKQRMQTGMFGSFSETIKATYLEGKGGISSFYKGFGVTIMREIPFALIQFPLYEFLKKSIVEFKNRGVSSTSNKVTEVQSYEGAICGSFTGGIAAALTTPLDVMKTRLMLGADSQGVKYHGVVDTFRRLVIEGNTPIVTSAQGAASGAAGGSAGSVTTTRGLGIFFSGVGPRVMWISIGGFVFFGAYEQSKRFIDML